MSVAKIAVLLEGFHRHFDYLFDFSTFFHIRRPFYKLDYMVQYR